MNQKLICQLCGGENDPSAQRCTNCGAVFETLPDDLRPMRARNAMTNATTGHEADRPASSGDADATEWLKKFYENLEPSGMDEPDEPAYPSQPLSDDEPAPDLLGELFPDIRDAIAAPTPVDAPPASAAPEPMPETLPASVAEGEGWLIEEPLTPRPAREAKTPEDAEERDFEDFSLYRPERKWDDFSLADGQDDPADTAPVWTSAKSQQQFSSPNEDNEADYVDFAKFRPETKLGDDGLGMDEIAPVTAAAPKFELNNVLNVDHDSEKSLSAQTENGAEINISERSGDSGEIQSGEEDYVDFSIYRPQNKLEPAAAELVLKDLPNAGEDAANEIPIEPAESFESSPLVDEFLASLSEEKPAASDETPTLNPSERMPDENGAEANSTTAYDEIAAFWNSDAKADSDDETPASCLSAMHGGEAPTAGDGRNEAETSSMTPRPRPVRTADDEAESDSPIPFIAKSEGADEIPWNLFENGEMVFPSLPSVSRAACKSAAAPAAEAADYQERMVAGILKKVFHAERLSRGMKNGQLRRKHRGGMLAFSLFALLGVILILMTNLGAGLPLTPAQGNAAVQSAAFSAALAEITAADRVEVILDYTFAFEAELNETTRFVVDEFRRIGTRLTVIAANDAAVTLAEELFPVTGDFGRVPVVAVMDPLGAFTLPPNESEDVAPKAIVLFAADAARAQRWIEAAAIFRPESDLYLVGAAQLAPVIRPFAAAGSVRAGLWNADERAFVSGAETSESKQLALWYLIGLALAAILIGTIARYPFTPVIATEDGETDEDSNDEDAADGEKAAGKGAGKR